MEHLPDVMKRKARLSAAAKTIADRAEAEGRTQLNPEEERDLGRIFGEYCELLSVEKTMRGQRAKLVK